ncbi:acyl-CoA thioesterase [Stappia sp. ICDLI1TA098]
MTLQNLQLHRRVFTKLFNFSRLSISSYADNAKLKRRGGLWVTMPAIKSDRGETHFLEVVLPEQANHYGTLYGANALHMMGKAAFVCATRHAGCAVVMAKADNIEFARPVRLGAIVDVRARVVFQGRSSMTVLVEVSPEEWRDAADGAPSISGRFMMVAVDQNGVPRAISVSDQQCSGGTTS